MATMATMATPSAETSEKKIRGWLGHTDSTPMDAEARGYPLASLGLAVGRRESRPIVDGHHGHHGHPSGQTPHGPVLGQYTRKLREYRR
jgi:hypothetical protein